MAQNSLVLPSNTSGLNIRIDQTNANITLASNNMGNIAPTTTYAGMFWLDTSTTNPTLWIRDVNNVAWISMGSFIYNSNNNSYLYSQNLGYTAANAALTINGHSLTSNFVISGNDITTGVISVANGGTGATTVAQAMLNLGGIPASGGNMTGQLGLKAYTETIVTQNYVSSGTNLDWSTGSVQKLNLIGNTTLSFINAVAGQSITLFVNQDSSGSRLLTFPTMRWAGGTAPTLSTGANKTDIFVILFDGTYYYGFTGGLAF